MKIETSARLHLSLIDLNGLEGRIDGGIGITLKNPSLEIECNENNTRNQILFDKNLNLYSNKDQYEEKIMESYDKITKYLGIDQTYTFKINKIYPIHHGLGLGTQLLLSIGKLISKMNNENLKKIDLAKIVQRGGASGIGVESFNNGGFIVDGGHKKEEKNQFLPSSASKVSPPPVLARYDFPEDWKIVLAIPKINDGASGQEEVNIFQTYTPININDVKEISYLTLMKLMPAVLEKDLDNFGDAINKIQNTGFKDIERKLQSDVVDKIINTMLDSGVAGAGMSSFGPTCFGITDTNTKDVKRQLEDLLQDDAEIIITTAKNNGYVIEE